MRLFVLFLALTSLLQVDSAFAVTQKQRRMLANLDTIESIFFDQYAPAKWKREFGGWLLEDEIARVAAKVRSGQINSIKEYQLELTKFFNSTVDYHVSIRYLSKEAASLPLQIKGAEGRYFIVNIERSQVSPLEFPFAVGDEVVAFNGKPVADEVASLLPFISNGNAETRQLLAELRLTSRAASRGLPVPKAKTAQLSIRRKGSDLVEHVSLDWAYTEESAAFDTDNTGPLDAMELAGGSEIIARAAGFSRIQQGIFDRQMTARDVLPFANDSNTAAPQLNRFAIGGPKSFVPELGEQLFEHDAGFFHTRIFKLANGKIVGLLRIPSYGGGAQETGEFIQLVKLLEETTDALVIDQVNNPGGSVPFLYSLASLLSNKELHAPYHRMALTQSDVIEAEGNMEALEQIETEEQAKQIIGPTIGGYPVSLELVQNFLRYTHFIVNEWRAGHRLTAPFFLVGVDKIKPHPEGQYTKPILILVNNLDFSGGDFFPAIMQDNGRARIMGRRTAGAGGYVLSAKFPNLMGIEEMNLTGSIAERIDQNPIENLGVRPDVEYKLTVDDLQNDMRGYKAAILNELSSML